MQFFKKFLTLYKNIKTKLNVLRVKIYLINFLKSKKTSFLIAI